MLCYIFRLFLQQSQQNIQSGQQLQNCILVGIHLNLIRGTWPRINQSKSSFCWVKDLVYNNSLKTELRISYFQHFHWLTGLRLSVHILALPIMVRERVNNFGFAFTSLSDWFKVLAPFFQPIRSEIQTNRASRVHIFPRFVSTMCNYFEFWLVYWIVSVLFDWPK